MELIFSQLITDDNMNPANLCSNAEFETMITVVNPCNYVIRWWVKLKFYMYHLASFAQFVMIKKSISISICTFVVLTQNSF